MASMACTHRIQTQQAKCCTQPVSLCLPRSPVSRPCRQQHSLTASAVPVSRQGEDSVRSHNNSATRVPSSESLKQPQPPTPSAELSFTFLSTVTLGLVGALSLALPDACNAAQDSAPHAHLTIDAAASSLSSISSAVQPQFELAEGEDFFANVARYGRYFVTVMLGTGYVMLKPLAGAFKNPLTGVLATVGVIGGAVLLKFTLELMLGVTDAGDLSFDYVQGNF